MALAQIPAIRTTLLGNYGVHRMSEEFIHQHRGPMGWDKVSFGLHPTHLVPTLDTFLDELNLIPDFTYSLTGSSVVLDKSDNDSDEWSFDATTSAWLACLTACFSYRCCTHVDFPKLKKIHVDK